MGQLKEKIVVIKTGQAALHRKHHPLTKRRSSQSRAEVEERADAARQVPQK